MRKRADNNLLHKSSKDFIPIACHYDKNTLITKNGQLLQTIQVNGMQAETISSKLFNLRAAVREAINISTNNQNYSFWIHTIRRKTNLDDQADYYKLLAANIHNIWQQKNHWRNKFVNSLYITVVHNASGLRINSFNSLVNSLSLHTIGSFEERFLARVDAELNATVDQILQHLSDYGAYKLGIQMQNDYYYSELMSLYGYITQLQEQNHVLPIGNLSTVLAASDYQHTFGNDKIEIGNATQKKFAAIIAIKEYQELSVEALDKVLQMPIEMVTTEVFYFIDKKYATKTYEDQDYILQVSKDHELRALKGIDKILAQGNNNERFCNQQISFMVISDDLSNFSSQVKKFSQALSKIGIVHVQEDINLEKTFWAQLPGNFAFLSRIKPTSIRYTAALASLHNFPIGNQYNPWGKAVTILRTEKGTPYFINFHDKSAKGATVILGNTRSGKTSLMNFLLSEADKYRPKILYITDDLDSSIYIKLCGGRWLQTGTNIVNPLLFVDNQDNRAYVLEFLQIIAKHYFDPLSAEELTQLKLLSETVLTLHASQRKLSLVLAQLVATAAHTTLPKRLQDYLEGGLYAQVFDTDQQINLVQGNIVAVNLQRFNDMQIKDDYPQERKFIEQFEYDLNSMRAVKAALVLVLQNVLTNAGAGAKILAIDNFSEILDLRYYSHLATAIQGNTCNVAHGHGVAVFNVNIETMAGLVDYDLQHEWLEQANTCIMMPSEVNNTAMNKILNLSQSEYKKLLAISIMSRVFLIKQDNCIVAVEMSMGGLPGIIKILSSSKKDRQTYAAIIKENPRANLETILTILYSVFQNEMR